MYLYVPVRKSPVRRWWKDYESGWTLNMEQPKVNYVSATKTNQRKQKQIKIKRRLFSAISSGSGGR